MGSTPEFSSEKLQIYLPTPIVTQVRELAVSRGVGISTLIRMLIMTALESK